MLSQRYCLRWKYHHSNLQTMFSQLLDRGCFCDVTLACEGQLIRAHRVVLCACSTFFDTVLSNYASERDPIIILKDVTFAEVKCLIEFMYKGEINIDHCSLGSLLKTADDLKIKGLAEVTWHDNNNEHDDGGAAAAAAAAASTTMPLATAEYRTSPLMRSMSDSYAQSLLLMQREQQRNCTPNSADAREQRMSPANGVQHQQHQQHRVSSAAENAYGLGALSGPLNVPLTIDVSPPPPEHFVSQNQKRKRGRPPLDDSYDVFNVRKMPHYGNAEHYLDATPRQQTQHLAATSPTIEAAPMYQQPTRQRNQQRQRNHQQQQQQKQQPQRNVRAAAVAADDADEERDIEWVKRNLEVNIIAQNQCSSYRSQQRDSDAPNEFYDRTNASASPTAVRNTTPIEEDAIIYAVPLATNNGASNTSAATASKKLEKRQAEAERDRRDRAPKTRHKRRSSTTSSSERPKEQQQNCVGSSDELKLQDDTHAIMLQPKEELADEEPMPADCEETDAADAELLQAAQQHGYNEPPLAGGGGGGGDAANVNGSQATEQTAAGADSGVETRSEDLDANESRLTNEEMSDWLDVIKMDDYLARGRRPQFWEEPFTKRVLDAIKNKRLEMKKASRILGVSYGTLYGRYREVYGCLKHPYSSSMFRSSYVSASITSTTTTTATTTTVSTPPATAATSAAASTTSSSIVPATSTVTAANASTSASAALGQLAVQSRFDLSLPNTNTLAANLDLGTIRPKDFSGLWTRPQI